MKNDASNTVNVVRFLDSTRRRLWLLLCRHEVRRLSWIVAALLLVVAAMHLVVVAISMTVIAIAAIAIFVAVVSRAVLVRPSMAGAAVAADASFDGRSTMTTAFEICERGTMPYGEAAEIVMAQASTATKSWKLEDLTLRNDVRTPTTAVTIISLFAAFVLLSMPGAGNRDGVLNVAAPDTGSTANIENDDVAGEYADIESLRRSLAEGAAEQSDKFEAGGTRQAIDNEQTIEASANADTLSASAAAATSSGSGGLPGTTAAQTRAQVTSNTVQYADRELISIARNGTILTTAPDGQSRFSSMIIEAAGNEYSILPATPPAAHSQWSSLSYSQAAYAQRYLDASGNNNE